MAIPDVSGLNRDELYALIRAAQDKLNEAEVNAEQVRATLADPATVRNTIEVLTQQATSVQGVLDTPNAQIKTDPQLAIKSIARAVKRTINADIRSLKLAASIYDDASVGDET